MATKMKTLLFNIFLVVLLQTDVEASSLKPPAVSALTNVRGSLKIYKSSHEGKLPKSWEDFISSGAISDEILDNARRYCDLENRYFFVNSEPVFSENGAPARIVIMAKQSGGEGNQLFENEKKETEEVAGRWIIVETSDGDIQTRNYTESQLEGRFQRAGLSLIDYTFDGPPPPKRSATNPDNRSNKSENQPLGGIPDLAKNDRPAKNKLSDQVNSAPQAHSWRIFTLIGGLFVAILAGWWMLKKKSP